MPGYSKEEQLGRGPKRPTRKKASKKRWEEIRARKDGPCRICGGAPPNQLHHLASRGANLGSDTENNIVPLCGVCHKRVTDYDREACAILRRSLSDAEYAYSVETLGEFAFESRYPVEYRKVS